ncbi:MAG: hypothetical protein ACK559_37450, partial [bacterium]
LDEHEVELPVHGEHRRQAVPPQPQRRGREAGRQPPRVAGAHRADQRAGVRRPLRIRAREDREAARIGLDVRAHDEQLRTGLLLDGAATELPHPEALLGRLRTVIFVPPPKGRRDEVLRLHRGAEGGLDPVGDHLGAQLRGAGREPGPGGRAQELVDHPVPGRERAPRRRRRQRGVPHL